MINVRRLVLLGLILGCLAHPAAADQDSPRLDPLFAQLQTTMDTEAAQKIERQIWYIWGLPDEDLASAPFAQGVIKMSRGDLKGARASFDRVVEVAPDFAEGWNKRATVLFHLGDLEGSVRDIQETIALEPRHFGALSGLSMIYEAVGNLEAALDVTVQVKEIYPGMAGIDARMQMLRDAIARKRT